MYQLSSFFFPLVIDYSQESRNHKGVSRHLFLKGRGLGPNPICKNECQSYFQRPVWHTILTHQFLIKTLDKVARGGTRVVNRCRARELLILTPDTRRSVQWAVGCPETPQQLGASHNSRVQTVSASTQSLKIRLPSFNHLHLQSEGRQEPFCFYFSVLFLCTFLPIAYLDFKEKTTFYLKCYFVGTS